MGLRRTSVKDNPTRLTSEILGGLGFYCTPFSEHTITVTDDGSELCICFEGEDVFAVSLYDSDENTGVYLNSFEYLHELEDLYFALTRTELK